MNKAPKNHQNQDILSDIVSLALAVDFQSVAVYGLPSITGWKKRSSSWVGASVDTDKVNPKIPSALYDNNTFC